MAYTVQAGDSWERIAGSVYGNQRFFEDLQKANRYVTLKPGMQLSTPDFNTGAQPFVSEYAASGGTYKANPGLGIDPRTGLPAENVGAPRSVADFAAALTGVGPYPTAPGAVAPPANADAMALYHASERGMTPANADSGMDLYRRSETGRGRPPATLDVLPAADAKARAEKEKAFLAWRRGEVTTDLSWTGGHAVPGTGSVNPYEPTGGIFGPTGGPFGPGATYLTAPSSGPGAGGLWGGAATPEQLAAARAENSRLDSFAGQRILGAGGRGQPDYYNREALTMTTAFWNYNQPTSIGRAGLPVDIANGVADRLYRSLGFTSVGEMMASFGYKQDVPGMWHRWDPINLASGGGSAGPSVRSRGGGGGGNGGPAGSRGTYDPVGLTMWNVRISGRG